MANDSFFCFTPFDFNSLHGSFGPPEDFEKQEAVFKVRQDHLFEVEDFGGTNISFPAECGFYEQNTTNPGKHKAPMFKYEFHLNTVFIPPTQQIQESTKLPNIPTGGVEILEHDKQIPQQASLLTSLELLTNYGSGFKKLKGERLSNTSTETEICVGSQRLSTEETMRVAGSRYVEFSAQICDDYYLPMHPFGFALSGLSEDETKDVELAHLLLATAEKVGYQQFDRASKLLLSCEWISSARANPVQRIVFDFAEALRERIAKETGGVTFKGHEQDEVFHQGLSTNPTFVRIHQRLPFGPVWQFTGIQSIIENVALESKVHLIDIEIRSGVQWTGFMQALAERQECPIELLKITAVGSTNKEKIEEAGTRLASVAESLNLPFSFKSVFVPDMKDLKEDLFEIEDDEAVVIYASLELRTMISRPYCLENLMRVIRNLNPSLMIVVEVEANHNSSSFVNRFIEALFYYSAFYDCIENCMKRNDERMASEAILRGGIRNIVAEEGSGRTTRSVKMDVWRKFYGRFKMEEIGFSETSLYQASLVVKQFGCSSFCTLDKNGKCLIVGWKGTPIHSLSAWKFR